MTMKKSLKYASFLILLLIVGVSVVWSDMLKQQSGEIHEITPPESGYVDPKPPTGCDQSATTTDCSKIIYTPPAPEVIEAQEPPLLDTTLNDEHLKIDNTLASVEFCGQTYQARQVFLDDVNVVERIGEITNKKYTSHIDKEQKNAEGICNNLVTNTKGEDELFIKVSTTTSDKIYHLDIELMPFSINFNTGNIYEMDMYAADLIFFGKIY